MPTFSKGFFLSGFPAKILHAFLISSRVIQLSFVFLSLIFYYLSARSAALCSSSFSSLYQVSSFLPTKKLAINKSNNWSYN
jgi:hypothetical protein